MEVTVADLRRRSLFIATPMYDANCSQAYFDSCTALTHHLTKLGIQFNFHTMGNESLIQRARNYCVDAFMRSGYTHLLFIDADIGFHPQAVIDLLAHAGPNSEYDVLCGPYPKKNLSPEKIVSAVKNDLIKKPDDLFNFVGDFVFNYVPGTTEIKMNQGFEVSEAGTGFMMIQRHTFERFAARFPYALYSPDHARDKHFDGKRKIYAYFDCEIDRGTFLPDVWQTVVDVANKKKGAMDRLKKIAEKTEKASTRYLSEDYQFCHMARASGSKVWMIPWVHLKHVGRFVFGGSLPHILSAKLSATYHAEDGKPKDEEKSNEPRIAVPF
jgi:hypothetical protein